MAIVLKEGNTYTSPQGMSIPHVYGVIDWILTDKKAKTHDIILSVFASKDARLNNASVIETMRINCTKKDLFDAYFSVSAIENDGNAYHKSYEYVLSEYKDEDGNLLLEDRQSDE